MTDTFLPIGEAAASVLKKTRKKMARPSFEAAKAAILADPGKSNFKISIDTGLSADSVRFARRALIDEGKI